MMNTTRILLALSAILLWDIHRLPAPIVEEPTPTPKPKRRVAAESEAAPREPMATATKPTPAPRVSCGETWVGTASGEMHAPLASPNYADNYRIEISADEKIANWTASRWLGAKFQAPIQKNGTTLTWNYEKHDIAGKTLISASLR